MDSFLGGQFSTYGLDVIRISGMEVSSLFREIAILSVYPFFETLRLSDTSRLPYFLNSQIPIHRDFRFTLFFFLNLWSVIDDTNIALPWTLSLKWWTDKFGLKTDNKLKAINGIESLIFGNHKLESCFQICIRNPDMDSAKHPWIWINQ